MGNKAFSSCLEGRSHAAKTGAAAAAANPRVERLRDCEQALKELIDTNNCAPILVRLAWHDSGTFDASKTSEPWPKAGGANGSIIYEPEINHAANGGLRNAIALLTPIKERFQEISWADIIQMASAVSIEVCGGPKIDMRYGRVDVSGPADCPPEGNLPAPKKEYFFDGSKEPEDHLRKVFYRMGFGDMEIVALSGAHTLGRAYKDRSGTGADSTKFTSGQITVRSDNAPGYGREGGSAWTPNWLTFDNSYFVGLLDQNADPELLRLETDRCLVTDASFRSYVEKYANSQDEFFEDYAVAHKKLSEQGSKFDVEGGIDIKPLVNVH